MEDKISLIEAVYKAKNIKNNGGIKSIRVELSNSPKDAINRVNLKSKELIEKLNK